MKNSKQASFIRVVWDTISDWDLWLSLLAGGGVVLFGLLSDQFAPSTAWFGVGASVSAAVAFGSWVAGRWVSERLESEYGEIVRTVEATNHGEVHLPYVAVSIVALASLTVAALAAAIVEGVSTLQAAILTGFVTWLFAWSLLGALGLIILSHRHQRNIDRVRRSKERAERLERSLGESADPS
jgi:hypothetical protein